MFKIAVSYAYIVWITTSLPYLDEWIDHFDFHTFIDGYEMFQVYWTSDQSNACTLEIGLAVQTDGWIGFGITESGSMSGADMVVGWVTDNDEYIIQNRIGPNGGNGYPPQFESQSGVIPINGWKEDINGTITTYLHFEKQIFPDFDQRALDVKVGTTRVIYAWRNGVLTEDSDITNHGFGCSHTACRGHESMNLLNGETASVPLPEGAQNHSIFIENVAISNKSTTYYCSLLELPHYDSVQHIVQIDPIITPENTGIVHHMIAYRCPEHMMNRSHIGKGTECSSVSENMPGVFCIDGSVFFGWAIGGKSFYFPDNVGLEMSGNQADSLQYVLLETHYDNSANRDDVIDSSGIKIWYTDTLRQYSASVLMVGLNHDAPHGIFVPPNIPNAHTYGFCFAECLQNAVGDHIDESVYMFANTLHSHVLGTKMYLRHIRNGKELRPIDMNQAYDFNYQQISTFSQQTEILNGDEFITECVYNSESKNDMTYGGIETQDEMCLAFLLVYPKTDLALCASRFPGYYNGDLSDGDLGTFFEEAIENGYYNATTDFYNVSVNGALQFYTEFQKRNQRVQTCMDINYEFMPSNENTYNALIADDNYNTFGDDNYYICQSSAKDSAFDWNAWYVYLVAVLIAVLLIALLIYAMCKVKNRNVKTNASYQRVLGKKQQQNDYGTATNPPEVSMEDRM